MGTVVTAMAIAWVLCTLLLLGSLAWAHWDKGKAKR